MDTTEAFSCNLPSWCAWNASRTNGWSMSLFTLFEFEFGGRLRADVLCSNQQLAQQVAQQQKPLPVIPLPIGWQASAPLENWIVTAVRIADGLVHLHGTQEAVSGILSCTTHGCERPVVNPLGNCPHDPDSDAEETENLQETS